MSMKCEWNYKYYLWRKQFENIICWPMLLLLFVYETNIDILLANNEQASAIIITATGIQIFLAIGWWLVAGLVPNHYLSLYIYDIWFDIFLMASTFLGHVWYKFPVFHVLHFVLYQNAIWGRKLAPLGCSYEVFNEEMESWQIWPNCLMPCSIEWDV